MKRAQRKQKAAEAFGRDLAFCFGSNVKTVRYDYKTGILNQKVKSDVYLLLLFTVG